MEILSLGEKIKRKRKELNMTLKDLAKDRITPGQISLVESGRSNPSMDLLEYLACNLNTTVEYLMETEEGQAEKISIYYEQISEAYLLSKNYLKSERYIDEALSYATLYKLEYRKARIMCLKADVLKVDSEFEEARYLYLSAIIIFIKNKKYEEIVKTFLKLGEKSIKLNAFLSANIYLKRAEIVYIENNIENEYLIGEIYYNISKVNYSIEKVEESKKYAYLTKEKFQRINDKEEYASLLLLLAEGKSKKGDLINATIYSTKALKLYKEIKESDNICKIQNNLGQLFYNFQGINEGYNQFENSSKSLEFNDKNNEIDMLINICENNMKIKNLDKCEEMLKVLYEKIDKNDVNRTISLNLIKYRVLTIHQKLEEAEKILIESYNLAKDKDKLKVAGRLSIMISKCYIDNKKDELAKKFLDEGVKIFEDLGFI